MKKIFYILFLFLCQLAFSQIENPNGTNKGLDPYISTTNAPTTPVKKPISLEPDNSFNGFKTANKKLEQKRRQKQREKKEDNEGIITREMIVKKKFNKNIEGNFMNFPQIDMDLGSFHTKSQNIHISSYDFGRFDGDKVMISINGRRVHNNYLLTPRAKLISIPLVVGINKIEVTAINEGDLVPNTGYFAFFDDSKEIIKEGQWMLATGAKVIAIIIRDEE